MTSDEATALLLEVLGRIAPEADVARIDPDRLLQDELDMDSLDFLALVDEVHERTGIDLPERDYPDLSTLAGFAAYLSAASGGGRT